MRYFSCLSICVLATAFAAAQVNYQVTQVYAATTFTAPGHPEAVMFVERNTGLGCDLTCTSLGYSFCLDEQPGCLEGSGEIPDSAFKGQLDDNYRDPETLTVHFNGITNQPYFLNYTCNAFDQEGNCTALTVVPGGKITVSLTKTPLYFDFNDSTNATLENGTFTGTSSFSDLFSDKAQGSIDKVSFTYADNVAGNVGASCCVAFNATLTITAGQGQTKRLSQVLAGKLPERVLRRIQILEKKHNQSH